jgi:nucleotide-binding universal stress UspA family protein
MDISMILVPIDFSDCALNSLRYATETAEKNNSSMVLLHVIDSREAKRIAEYTKEPLDKVTDRLKNQARQMFRRFLKEWDNNSRISETIVSCGPPFQEISIKAREIDADMVIMGGYGSRGKGQIDEIFFGSTVEKVIRLLPCPVLCVPVDWPEEDI